MADFAVCQYRSFEHVGDKIKDNMRAQTTAALGGTRVEGLIAAASGRVAREGAIGDRDRGTRRIEFTWACDSLGSSANAVDRGVLS